MRSLLRAVAMDESEPPIAKDAPAAAEITPLAENAEYREQSETLRRIGAEIASLDREIKAIEVATYLRAERRAGRDATPDFVRPGSEIELALKIVNGENVDLRTDADRLATARAKIERLRPGYAAQKERVEQLRERLSAEACEALRERHRTILRNFFAACRSVGRAATAERTLYQEISAAGYVPMGHILPPSQMGPAIAFDEISFSSPLSHFRRQLEGLGILPKGGA
jgi:hypothetical protein